jgi:hypothetical protein
MARAQSSSTITGSAAGFPAGGRRLRGVDARCAAAGCGVPRGSAVGCAIVVFELLGEARHRGTRSRARWGFSAAPLHHASSEGVTTA